MPCMMWGLFIVRRRFDFLAMANVLKNTARCHLSVAFVCDMVYYTYVWNVSATSVVIINWSWLLFLIGVYPTQ